jgi:threonine dehydratase
MVASWLGELAMSSDYDSTMISPDEISATYARIASYMRRTPVLELGTDPFEHGLAANVTLKLEALQCSGSFKARGAFANLLLRTVPRTGVVAASGGNHGAAVAYAAAQLGVPAHIFVPSVSAPAKMDRIRRLGAELVIAGDRYADALAASQHFIAEQAAMPIHAFDQRETLLGQGSLAAELSEQAPDLDTVLVPVGGGGLVAGIAAWYAGRVRVIGVEPATAPTLTRAHAEGQPVDAPAGGVAADSLAPPRVGELVFPITQQQVSDVVTVSDAAITQARHTLWETVRQVAEPAGAVGIAAVLEGAYRPEPGERIAIVISGANTDPGEVASTADDTC